MSDSDRPTDAGISIFSTLEAFTDGLTATLSRSAAADVCRGWVATIEAANRPDLMGIRDGLATLARQLDGQDGEVQASAADIGQTMQALGAHTAEAASSIGEDHLVAPLERLGGYVRAAGIALTGGQRADTIEGIDTLSAGTTGDLTPRGSTSTAEATQDDDRAGTKGLNDEISDSVMATPGDETPGTALNPH